MSAFGDEKYHMNDLYDELNRFVNEGGTLAELFEVLRYFFSDYDTKLKELEELENKMIITIDDKPVVEMPVNTASIGTIVRANIKIPPNMF